MESNIEYENLNLCAECGGKCCKNNGCGYLPKDFENMFFGYLKNRIDLGDISISVRFASHSNDDIITSPNPILLLKVRNEGRGIIDLFSMGRPCSVLTDKGCPYPFEKRPSDGKNLIPGKNGCDNIYPLKNILEDWSGHQKVMQKLYRSYAKCSMDDQIKQDIINVKKEIKEKTPHIGKMNYSELKVFKHSVSTIEFLSQFEVYKEETKEERK